MASVALSGDTAIAGSYLDDVGTNAGQGSAYVFTRSGTTWTQQAQLSAPDGAANDHFGISVALSGDTAIVGARWDDVGANSNQGSAYVFVRSGTTWTQQAQLAAPDGAAGEEFGFSVALSGDTAIVGAYLDDVATNSSQGSAWVFSRVGTRWIGPDLTLLAYDGASGDWFGRSVALSGDTAIVGAVFDNGQQGSAYVFTRSGTTWTQQQKLTASDGAGGDFFGSSVALYDDTAIVGAYSDNVGANGDQGSAYVFVRSGTTWTQQQKLTASDGAGSDDFGYSVALYGDTAIVGAFLNKVGANDNQGSAYVFVRSGTMWTQQQKLIAADGAAFDEFGWSVAISGDTAIVGALYDDVDANAGQGSAYVFVRSGTTWTQQAQLTTSDGAAIDNFGYSVALSGDTAIVGASQDDVGANSDQGSAYVFVRSGTSWTQRAQLTASDGAASDFFGHAVAVSGDLAIVGAYNDDVGASSNQGSAYVFARSGSSWFEEAHLIASDGAANDHFGDSVALSDDTAILGAYRDEVGANVDQGSAHVFDVPYDCFSLAHNDSLDIGYPTLAAAFLQAQSGHQITATPAAFAGISSLDTLGRSLGINSTGDLRTPSTSTLTLGGSSYLAAAEGEVMGVFGQLRVSSSASADLYSDGFTLGAGGILTARTNSSLTIDAPATCLEGQSLLQQGSSMTFADSVDALGPMTAAFNAMLTAGNTFTNLDAFSITSGTISAPLFYNRAAANFFGSAAVFGDYTNEAGAVTTIGDGTLFVFGSLTNNGAIIGDILEVGGSLVLGPAAALTMPFDGSRVYVGGDYDCAIDANTRYELSAATLQLEGTGAERTLEVMSADIGPDVLGLDRSLAGHYPIGTLYIGPSPSTVRLVDAHDNDGQGQSACEAIYVDTLRIDAGSRLVNPSCRIYYNVLVNNGAIDLPDNVVPFAPIPGDCDGDGDLQLDDWGTAATCMAGPDGGPIGPGCDCADFDGDVDVDLADFAEFQVAFGH